jgi:hypothetical protein
VVADAKPVIVLGVEFASNTCLISRTVESYEPTVTVCAILTESSESVKVAEVPAVLDTIMLVTIVVVDVFGTVYKVVDEVEAAPLYRVLDIVAINYYPFLVSAHYRHYDISV